MPEPIDLLRRVRVLMRRGVSLDREVIAEGGPYGDCLVCQRGYRDPTGQLCVTFDRWGRRGLESWLARVSNPGAYIGPDPEGGRPEGVIWVPLGGA